jgi:hypothetical protein
LKVVKEGKSVEIKESSSMEDIEGSIGKHVEIKDSICSGLKVS